MLTWRCPTSTDRDILPLVSPIPGRPPAARGRISIALDSVVSETPTQSPPTQTLEDEGSEHGCQCSKAIAQGFPGGGADGERARNGALSVADQPATEYRTVQQRLGLSDMLDIQWPRSTIPQYPVPGDCIEYHVFPCPGARLSLATCGHVTLTIYPWPDVGHFQNI